MNKFPRFALIWDVEEGQLYWVKGTDRRVSRPAIRRLDPATSKVENRSFDHDASALKHLGVYNWLAKEVKSQFLAGNLFRITWLRIRRLPEP